MNRPKAAVATVRLSIYRSLDGGNSEWIVQIDDKSRFHSLTNSSDQPQGLPENSPAFPTPGANPSRSNRVPEGRLNARAPRGFPQPSKEINPATVTNNLDRAYRKLTNRSVRPNQNPSEANAAIPIHAANSLFHNILPTLLSIQYFARTKSHPPPRKPKRINISPPPLQKK